MTEARTIAEDAASQQDMLTAQYELATVSAKDPRLFHFCFYKLASALDERLARGGPLFDDLADEFFRGMRTLWILARAMDEHSGRGRYFRYVQARYLQISREIFGRAMEVVGAPMRGVARPAH